MTRIIQFTVYFTCDVCGIETNNYLVLDTKFWDEVTGLSLKTGKHWSVNYADHRHTQCEIDHGSFKEMTSEYEKKMKVTPQEAEDFVKQNRKRVDFDKKLTKVLKDNKNMV